MIAGLPREDIKPAVRWYYEDPTVNLSKLAEVLEEGSRYGEEVWL
jgi:hypothetical protein